MTEKEVCRGQCPECRQSVRVINLNADGTKIFVYHTNSGKACAGSGDVCTAYERTVKS